MNTITDTGSLSSFRYREVYEKGKPAGKSYEWYESGRIKKHIDCDQNQRILFDKQGNITKQGKA